MAGTFSSPREAAAPIIAACMSARWTRRHDTNSFDWRAMPTMWRRAICCSWTATPCSPSRSTAIAWSCRVSPHPSGRASAGPAAGTGRFQPRGRERSPTRAPRCERAASPGSTAAGLRSAPWGPTAEHDYADFRLSGDDTRLAASLVDPKLSLPDVWLFDLARGAASRLTFGPVLNAAAVWSPQGDRIAFRTNRKGVIELYQMSAVEGGNDEPLVTGR